MRTIGRTVSRFVVLEIDLFGVNDKKEVKGIGVGKETYAKIINEIKQKTDFKITPEIEEIECKKVLVLAISE